MFKFRFTSSFIRSYCTLVSLFLLSEVAHTQNADVTKADTIKIKLDEIQISSQRYNLRENIPFSIKTIPVDDFKLNNQNSNGIRHLFSQTIGVTISERNNDALSERISIRGSGWQSAFGIRGIQMFYGIIPLTTADGQAMTELINNKSVSQINIIKGASSWGFGNSSGGVLQFDKRISGITLTGGSYRVGMDGTLFGESSISKNGIQFFSDVNYTYNNGYRDHSISEFFKSSIIVRDLRKKNRVSTLQMSGVYAPWLENPGGLTFQQFKSNPRQAQAIFVNQNAGKEITHIAAAYSTDTFGEAASSLKLFVQKRKIYNPLTYAVIDLDRTVGGISYSGQRELSNFDLGYALDVQYQNDTRVEFENNNGNQGEKTNQSSDDLIKVGVGLNLKKSVSSFDFIVGYYLESYDLKWAIGYMAGLNYSIGKQIDIYINTRSSYDQPTINERINKLNSELDPLYVNSYELGIRYEKGISGEVSLFYNNLNNLISPYQNEDGRTLYENRGQGNMRGVELELSEQIISKLKSVVTYTFISSDIKEKDTLRYSLPGIPDHQFETAHSLDINDNWSYQLSMISRSTQWVNNLNSKKSDGFYSVNMAVQYQMIFSNLKLMVSFIVNNLTDTNYSESVTINAFGDRYFEPAYGRNLVLGITGRF